MNKLILQWQPIPIQMTYIDFVTAFDRVERIKHCNLIEIEKDEGHIYETGKRKYNIGQILSNDKQMKWAVKKLKQFILDEYNIELIGEQTHLVHLCHLCKNNSYIHKKDKTKCTCSNPFHIYFGTVSENSMDRDYQIRKERGLHWGAISQQSKLNSGTHTTQTYEKCQYCEFSTTTLKLKGHHIHNCRFNPNSNYYLKPLDPRTVIKYKNQGLLYKEIELQTLIDKNNRGE